MVQPAAADEPIMRIATWNVNSIRIRLPKLLPWLERSGPEVVCLQETKVTDDIFPTAEIEAVGYRSLDRKLWAR